MELREQLRGRIAALVGAEPLAGRADDEHDRRLQHRPRRARARPGRRDRDDDGRALRPARSAATSGARIVVVAPEPGRHPRRGNAPDAAARALAGDLDDGPGPAGARASGRDGIPVLVDGAQSVGAIPVAAAGFDYLTISGQKWLCGPDATGALVVADPEALRGVGTELLLAGRATSRTGTFEPKPGAARFDPGWWPPSSLAGLLAALDGRPSWAFDHAAARRRALPASFSPTGSRWSARPSRALDARRLPCRRSSPPRSSRRSTTAACTCARSRARGLIRVSCGWWTSDGDLDRLLAALAE